MNVHVPESRKTLIDFRLFVKSRHISIVDSCIQRTRDFERCLFVCLLWVCEFFIFFIFLFFNNFIYFMAVTTQTDFKIFNLEYHKKVSKVEHTCLLAISFYGSLHSARFCYIDLLTKGPNKALLKCKSWTKL